MPLKSDRQRRFMFASLKNKTSMAPKAAAKFLKDSGVSSESIKQASSLPSNPEKFSKLKNILKGIK